MALTHNGTRVDVPAAELPAGYTKPSVTTFSDHEMKYLSRSIEIAKGDVENATATTTMTAIIAALNTAIETLLGADFDETANDVDSYAVLKSLSTNMTKTGVLFTNGAVNYVCVVDIYVKSETA